MQKIPHSQAENGVFCFLLFAKANCINLLHKPCGFLEILKAGLVNYHASTMQDLSGNRQINIESLPSNQCTPY